MPDPAARWPALADARRADPSARVPFSVMHHGRPVRAGSVARRHLPLLARWPEALAVDHQGVRLTAPAADRAAVLAAINLALRADGAIRAWRDETFAVLALPPDPAAPDPAADLLATHERAAARFWGTATFGAHCNGYRRGADGRPSHLWIARRADDKPTDPGLLDNLIGGGVPHGQSPAAAVVREGWEEAGLRPGQMIGLRAGRVLRVARDIREGFQLEWLHVYDLALPDGLVPRNQDGEVQSIDAMPVDEALARCAAGEFTVDAALATLDFAWRHGLLPDDQAALLGAGLRPLVAAERACPPANDGNF